MANSVTSAIKHIGLSALAKKLGYFPSAIQKWRDDGRLPQSELAGLTNYADVIAEMSDGRFSAEQLLAATRAAWVSKHSDRKRARA
jgi:hypothetical protein